MTVNLAAEKPTIKILLYTDDQQFSESQEASQFLGLGMMIERLQAHAPTFANLTTTLVNRNSPQHAANKLDAVLANESFDEIWFFGSHQGNTPGEPQCELDINEIQALRKWMTGNAQGGYEGGGVLMTGDHSNPAPSSLVANPESPCGDVTAGVQFLGLGRAIGHCVPRAGSLRLWEGPPTFRATDSFSTLAGFGFQMDRTPQELSLENVNQNGDPDLNGAPHPLFFYNDEFIRVFPDHGHEGAVVIPDTLDESWPAAENGQTPIKPHVVARSRDNRNENVVNTLAAYNGDLAGVGRIVADSTWHHYTNLNLLGFSNPAPVGTAADQIGQFYANLAIWLAPRGKRLEMALAMCWQVAQYTFMQEPDGDIESLTAAATSLLAQSASACEAHELTHVLLPERSDALPKALAGNRSDTQQLLQLFLGRVIDAYHHGMIKEQEQRRSQAIPRGTKLEAPSMRALLDAAFSRAFKEHAQRLTMKLEALGFRENNS